MFLTANVLLLHHKNFASAFQKVISMDVKIVRFALVRTNTADQLQ